MTIARKYGSGPGPQRVAGREERIPMGPEEDRTLMIRFHEEVINGSVLRGAVHGLRPHP
jgi:hypothetical protein